LTPHPLPRFCGGRSSDLCLAAPSRFSRERHSPESRGVSSLPKTLLALLALLLFVPPLLAQNAQPLKRVAILNFDSPSQSSNIVGADAGEVGKGVSAQLIPKLLASGKYFILDRDSLQKILKEQAEAETAGLDAYALASKVGRVANLDALIIGAVTLYGPDDPPSHPSSGVHTRKSKAYVQLTARVFNISTGEVLAEFLAHGESDEPGLVTTFADKKSKSSTQMLDSNFVGSLFPQATRQAVDQLASLLNGFADKIPSLTHNFDGLVAEVVGDTLTLNLGKRSGLRPGDQLAITRNTPASDATPDSSAPPIPHQIGVATITAVAEDSSTATFAGSTTAQVGDRTRSLLDTPAPSH